MVEQASWFVFNANTKFVRTVRFLVATEVTMSVSSPRFMIY